MNDICFKFSVLINLFPNIIKNINSRRVDPPRVMKLIGKIPSIFFTLTSQISELVTVDVVFRNSVQSNNQLKLDNNSTHALQAPSARY